MLRVLLAFVRTLFSCLQTHRDLALENLALRHQIAVLRRSGPKRPRLGPPDRALWAWLCGIWPPWRQVLVLVQPATVIRWHREGFRLFWRCKSSPAGQPGRPSVDKDVIQLIRSIAEANPGWGAPRVHGELRKLGIDVAQSTVSKYMPAKPRKPPSQTWRAFLDNHVGNLASIDFFPVHSATFRVLFVLLVLSHDRRRIVHFNVTANPSAAWTAQQIAQAFPEDSAPKYMIRDRDAIYGEIFRRRVRNMGIEQVVTAARSPWQNPYCERLIGSIRRECLDHVIVLGENHLRAILREYFAYYHRWRTHLSLAKDCPEPRAVQRPEQGEVIALPQVGGLHHGYVRRAA